MPGIPFQVKLIAARTNEISPLTRRAGAVLPSDRCLRPVFGAAQRSEYRRPRFLKKVRLEYGWEALYLPEAVA